MARKHRDDEDDFEDAEDTDTPDDEDEEDEEDLEDEDEEEADEDEEADDAEDAEDAEDEEEAEEAADAEEEEEEEERELPPRPRTPIFTIVLLILNFLVVPPFVLLLFMDYAARHQWEYATFLNRVYAWGLPLAEDENATPAWYYTRPRLRIDGDKLKDVYSKRPKAPGTPAVPEQFQAVDTVEEPVSFRITPSQIDEQAQRDLFTGAGLGPGVTTQEEEVARMKALVPGEIEKAAEAFVAAQNTPDKKLQAARDILLAVCWSPKQIDALEQQIEAAKANPAALDALLKDAVQRHLLIDLLAPMNIYRPGDVEQFSVEKAADYNAYPLPVLQDLLAKRFDQAVSGQHIGAVHYGKDFEGKPRDDIQKRHAIAFLLFDLARLKAPGAKEMLLPRYFERAQVVCGMYEFTQAAANYVRCLRVLDDRVVHAIEVDREGYIVQGKDLTRTDTGFVQRHGAEIRDMKKLVAAIEFTRKRVKDLTEKRDFYEKQYNARLELLNQTTKDVVEARQKTAKMLSELRELQEELFTAQKQLSDAAERNARLEAQIRAAEAELTGRSKGRNKQ